ncbi:long-chain fatty acid--CoA ligase [Reinekea sp. G2M2-21]|uniref:long-chain fatty acid--CoA ligase n=1 Tax=Reinekea sp. G2M2-21 TaxID=2788942 RepID=UPI0018ABD076|nr:long-chain fatty acid--CoA ligase [Reinekea sp. G2M2-21]
MSAHMMDYPLNTSDILKSAALRFPQQEIVSAMPNNSVHRYHYIDAYRRSCKVANLLSKQGFAQGSRIATLAVNHYRHFELYYGISGMGCVVHTLNARLFVEQLDYIINHAEDQWLFVDPELLPQIEALAGKIPTVKRVVVLCEEQDMPSSSSLLLDCYETLIAAEPDSFDWPRLDSKAPCGLCYTSGTTGNPKGVMYEQGSTVLHAMMSGSSQYLNFDEWSVAMPIVPMYHVVAWGVPFSAPLFGAKLVLPGCALTGENIHRLIDAEKITQAYAVPTIWLTLHNYLQQTGLTIDSLKMVGVGGAASPKALVKTYAELYDVYWMGIWGMTETSPLATAANMTPAMTSLTRDERYELQSSAGKPMFGVEIDIFDAAGRPLPHDGETRGNLRVRGPWILSSYFKGEGQDKFIDGWFETGDVAVITSEGYLRVVDRSKDVIKSGGEWISSVELENAALHYEAVNEACVIGAAHEKWDERPIMLITLRANVAYEEQALRRILQEKVAKWWLPDAIIVVDELPHTGTGKLRKVDVRDTYRNYLLDLGKLSE